MRPAAVFCWRQTGQGGGRRDRHVARILRDSALDCGSSLPPS
jgi:hypothetical protein